MNNNPIISIIVPIHNAEKTLDKCIRSILDQSYKHIECILIENGSHDDSWVVCQKYALQYPQVKSISSSEKGVSAARNLGLSMATGDIIGFCDADDFLEINTLKTVVAEFLEYDAVGVISAFYIGKDSEKGIKKQYSGLKKRELSVEDAILLTLGDSRVMGSVWNKYYRADIAKAIMFDTTLSFCEDMHYNIKIMSGMENMYFRYIMKPTYCYMMNDNSVTHQMNMLYDENAELKYIVAYKKILQDCKLSAKSKSVIKMRIATLAINYLWYGKNSELQREKLKKEIKQNFLYFICNITRFNFVGNAKSFIKFFLIFARKC